MRTEWLEYYVDAVRLGSIKASADLHCISPQGMSKAIRSLEAEMGMKLFKRGANSVQPTPEGALLLPSMGEAIEAIRSLSLQASRIADVKTEVPLLALCSSFLFICGMAASLKECLGLLDRPVSYLQVDTDSMIATMLGRQTGLSKGKELCGFPLFFGPLSSKNAENLALLAAEGYTYVPIMRYIDVLLVSSQHPLASKEVVTKAEIAQYPIVSSSVEQLRPLTEFIGEEHISAAIADLETRLEIILDNRSVMFVPPFLQAGQDSHYSFVPVSEAYNVELGFLHGRQIPNDDVHRILSRFSKSYRSKPMAEACQVLLPEQ